MFIGAKVNIFRHTTKYSSNIFYCRICASYSSSCRSIYSWLSPVVKGFRACRDRPCVYPYTWWLGTSLHHDLPSVTDIHALLRPPTEAAARIYHSIVNHINVMTCFYFCNDIFIWKDKTIIILSGLIGQRFYVLKLFIDFPNFPAFFSFPSF